MNSTCAVGSGHIGKELAAAGTVFTFFTLTDLCLAFSVGYAVNGLMVVAFGAGRGGELRNLLHCSMITCRTHIRGVRCATSAERRVLPRVGGTE